jgi:hypothetical protein
LNSSQLSSRLMNRAGRDWGVLILAATTPSKLAEPGTFAKLHVVERQTGGDAKVAMARRNGSLRNAPVSHWRSGAISVGMSRFTLDQ